jgi:ATP-binding cassette subfamily F protein 3
MEALSTKTLELSLREPLSLGAVSGAIHRHRLFYGNYAYYLERIANEEKTGSPGSASPVANKVIEQAPPSAIERREQEKQKQALKKRLLRVETEILKSMEELESEKKSLEEELARPEVYSSREKAGAIKLRLDETAAALDAKSREWEAVAEELRNSR